MLFYYIHACISCVLLKTCSIEHITKFSPFQLIENCRIYRKNALEHFDTDKYFESCAQKHACFFAVGQKICVKLPTIKFNEDQFSSSQAVNCSETYNS